MADTKPFRKQRQKDPKSHLAPSGAERLKTVVRRLPPNLPEEIFWQSVQAWVSDDTVTWKSYWPGKLRNKGVNKEGLPSRAYIAFKNEEQVATFSREYDGHLFRDKAGNESHAVVEFAPFQKVPAEKKKVDARNNTIDKDEDYISFLETLKNATKTESVSLEALIAASQPPPHPTTTPLLEALKAEKSAQKDKEAILRNHAHYKEVVTSGASSKKEEAKKKAAAVQAAKQPEPPAPPSKKAKKAAAAQKASSAQAQDGQGAPGKSLPAAPSTTKPPAPASITGHAPRNRSHKDQHGRPHPGKGDTSASVSTSVPVSGSGPTSAKPGPTSAPPVTTENALPPAGPPGPVPTQGQRKSRPTIGLGRQFEAALSGAGVAVAPSPGGNRKKRDKGGESGSGMAEVGGKGGKHRGEHLSSAPVAAVPSILQRPEVGGSASPDVAIMRRPTSPREPEGSGTHGDTGAGAGAARGGARRGRGRGRGGHRGG